MAVNRGKKFEERVREAIEKQQNVSIIRLIDPQAGYAGVRNICDFVAYRYPYQYILECKSHHGTSMPFSAITDNQRDGIEKIINNVGVVGGILVWFVDLDRTFFLPIQMISLIESIGRKSVNVELAEKYGFEIDGKKKRVMFDYDFTSFFNTCTPVWVNNKVINLTSE